MTATSPSPHPPYTLGSKFASATVLLLVLLAYTLSLWQDAGKGGEGGRSGLSWSADGLIGVLYAVPLFLASTIVCIQYARTKAFYPFATGTSAQRSPDRVLFWLRVLILVGNVVQFAPHLEFHGSGGGDIAAGTSIKRGPKQDVDASTTPSSALSTSPWWFWSGLEGVSKAAGLPVFWNVGWLFVLAMRSPALAPLQAALGLGYEHTIALHRLMGWSTTFWLMLHSIGYIVAYLAEGRATTMLLPGSDKSNMNVVGWIGSLLLVFMAVTALYQVRRSHYSLFAIFHWHWIPFALCCILHVPQDAMVILPALALYLIDRLLLISGAGTGFLGGARVTATAIRVSDDVVVLLIPVGPSRADSTAGTDSELDTTLSTMYAPGRFLCLASPNVRVTPAHPFSIAAYSAPNRTAVVMIRALGPFTKALHAIATLEGSPVPLRVSPPQSAPVLHVPQEFGAADTVEKVTADNAAAALGARVSPARRIVVAGGIGVSKYLAGPFNDAESTSAETVRKIWLCKSPIEFHMYQALGANLSGWDVYCKHGFDLHPVAPVLATTMDADAAETDLGEGLMAAATPALDNSTGTPRATYPLFAQCTTLPISAALRTTLFLTLAGAYAAIYTASRAPTYATCSDPSPAASFWAWIECTRWSTIAPYFSVLVGLPLVTQVVMAVVGAVRWQVRPAGEFRTHGTRTPEGPEVVGKVRALVPRRLDVGKVLGLDGVEDGISGGRMARVVREARAACSFRVPGVQVRVCASKPVRSAFRRATHAVGGEFVDDGVGF
ncbi:hypothetical protein AMAG_07049 [Allomyces macrogynus ATCC 38327]|uniref:FAD-binding FR-type domain-containing protein n=1 Tax=Allomyces macrogynus (strain ATCC 38327) TaxID=578462 RepID=A0A0L0SFN5_ALLM3|nr:hypothetical protein AMAG_07045 [Allomyces macrogynus ATCC 38327]KNE61311.1 hypothetical protein AMAG_07049 [Allomyces macrogynus ATCC 38327]|eukprot:KNE61305.1 hypothetical protein AMAG_07045 [Allomyces macrogynus ATCC 38327]